MKNFYLYAIGNALVDLEYLVTPDYLKKMSIEKGVMTLIDSQRMEELLGSISTKKSRQGAGGSAANTVFAAAQLGTPSAYACVVADDPMGLFYMNELVEAEVSTSMRPTRKDLPTGRCLVLTTEDADRTMLTSLGISTEFSKLEVDESFVEASEIVYIEGYLVATEHGFEGTLRLKELALKHDKKIALTLSDPFMVKMFYERFQQLMDGRVDILFCNESELLEISKEQSIESSAKKLLTQNSEMTLVVTLGSLGAAIYTNSSYHQIAPYRVKAIDTNGAGDMFAGAFLYGQSQGWDLKRSGDFASFMSSKVVARYGARLSLEEILSAKKQFLEC